MNHELNILYQSDNNYAPQTGVSLVSLLENNREMTAINVFILDDGISEENLGRMREACDSYGRNLTIVDTTEILAELKRLEVTPFRNTYTTYFKLLAIDAIETSNNLLLQLDGDTIINESLEGLFAIDLEEKVCAATYECVQNEYKELIGLKPNEKYYNCGVLWINQAFWRSYDCRKKIIDHLTNERNTYFTVDQDIINVLFRDRIEYLDIVYNVNSGFYVYGADWSYYIYDLDPAYYVSKEVIRHAVNHPIINHCMVPMTGRPWEQDNIHPQNDLYDHYLAMSPWRNVPKIQVRRSMVFRLQRRLYQMFPMGIYARVHKAMLKRYLKDMDRKSREGTL